MLLFMTVSVAIFQITAMQDRFLAPIFVPIILLFISAIEECIRLIQKSRWGISPKIIMKLGVVSLPCLVLAGFLPRTIAFATQFERLSILTGNLYNDSIWNQKDIIQYLHDNPFKSEDVLYSNIAGGVAFHTWHTVFRSPRNAAAIDPEKEYSLEMFRGIFNHPGKDLYLIWIEPSSYSHVFTPKIFRTILSLERLVVFKDGSKIFQVKLLAPIE